ncbi:MAG: glycosyltransferase family 2 protein [Zavarzinella sp.]
MPRITVIVPVYNEQAHLNETLAGLANQTLPVSEYEVLLIDGGSTDQTLKIAAEFQQHFACLQILHNPKRYSSSARNIGVRHAKGEYLLIVDGHCAVKNPSYLQNVIQAFDRSGADCLGRPQPLETAHPTSFQKAVSVARQSWLGHNPDSAIYSSKEQFVAADNVAVAYHKSVFEKIGFFDERFDACEDVDFNVRARKAGLTCYFTPEIALDYKPRATPKGLIYQMMRYGQGRARLGKKDPSSITLPSLVPPFLVLWLAGTAVAAVLSQTGLLVFAASVACYMIVILGESIRTSLSNTTGGISFWRVILVFLSIHFGFAWGYIKESVAVRR